MKKTLSLLLVFVMMSITLVSCGGMSEKDIVGEWVVSDIEVPKEAAEELGMSVKEAEESMMGLFSLVSYNFKEDGKLVLVSFGQETPGGEWKLEGKKVVTDDGTFEIKGKTLVLEEDGAKIVLKKK